MQQPITDLVQIRLLGEKKRDENLRFRRHMKSHDHSDRILRRIAEDVEEQIDCTQCANCCRKATARVTERDVHRLARHFRVKEQRIMADYVVEGGEEDYILRRREDGECVFLSGNLCTVYEARPEVCQRYPHLVRGSGSLASRMWEMADRAIICPIVYNTLEAFKGQLKFQK
jgi:Fe-S-cluster containining protein